MKNAIASLIFVFLLSQTAYSQTTKLRKQELGVSFILNDFKTADRIRSGSLAEVIREDQMAEIGEMAPGLALSYYKGLKSHLDFAGTLAASFVNYPFPNKPLAANDGLLLEVDASVQLKLLSENYWVTPFVSAGIGASKYKNNYGAILPLGGGLKINFFDEAAIILGTQYRIPVSAETTNYHFMYSFGVSGVIGKK